jgi:hypothetical protein
VHQLPLSVPAHAGKRVIKKAELRGAIREMLDTEGPYLLEVMVPVRCRGKRGMMHACRACKSSRTYYAMQGNSTATAMFGLYMLRTCCVPLV